MPFKKHPGPHQEILDALADETSALRHRITGLEARLDGVAAEVKVLRSEFWSALERIPPKEAGAVVKHARTRKGGTAATEGEVT
jgi:hypothetical protein